MPVPNSLTQPSQRFPNSAPHGRPTIVRNPEQYVSNDENAHHDEPKTCCRKLPRTSYAAPKLGNGTVDSWTTITGIRHPNTHPKEWLPGNSTERSTTDPNEGSRRTEMSSWTFPWACLQKSPTDLTFCAHPTCHLHCPRLHNNHNITTCSYTFQHTHHHFCIHNHLH